MFASSDYHFERSIDDVMPAPPASSPEPAPTVGLRRPSHDPDAAWTNAAPPGRRADALQRGISGGVSKGGMGVAAMIQEGSLSQHSGLHSDFTKIDLADCAADRAPTGSAAPALTVLERARADSRSKTSAASARRPSRELTSALANISFSAFLAAEHGADYALDGIESHKDASATDDKSAAAPDARLVLARRSSREAGALRSLGARRTSAGIDERALALALAPARSLSALVSEEYFAPPTLRDDDAPQAVGADATHEVESSIERALRVNWEAAIARGEAPKRRPSRDLQGIDLSRTTERAYPSAASLSGH